MQKGIAIFLVLAIFCGLVGCGQDNMPEVSSVSIGKDGVITHQIVGDFEQNYYEMDGLKTLASDRVEEYCANNGQDSVTLASVDEKDGRILIQLSYATDRDYSDFNHREMFVGTLTEALEQGYPLEEVAFVSTQGKAIEIGDMDDRDKKQVVIIATKPTEELLVSTYGKVLYANRSEAGGTEVSFYDKKGVHIAYPASEDTDECVLSYIIFE